MSLSIGVLILSTWVAAAAAEPAKEGAAAPAPPSPGPEGPGAGPPPPSPAPAVPAPAVDATQRIKVGGQIRLRSEYRNQLKPDTAGDTSGSLIGQRARANVGVGTDRVKGYVEVQDARNWGMESSTTSNERNADLHQAYLLLPEVGHKGISLTLGRQELAYGDERLLGALDWSTVGRSFDGGVVRYAWKSGMGDGIGALVNERGPAGRGARGT